MVHTTQTHTQRYKQSFFLTTLRQHANSYKYGTPHQVVDVLEGPYDVFFLQFDLSFTTCDLFVT